LVGKSLDRLGSAKVFAGFIIIAVAVRAKTGRHLMRAIVGRAQMRTRCSERYSKGSFLNLARLYAQ
jgi:hypothetical protein